MTVNHSDQLGTGPLPDGDLNPEQIAGHLSRRRLLGAAAGAFSAAAALPLLGARGANAQAAGDSSTTGTAAAPRLAHAPSDGGGYRTEGGFAALDPGGPAVLNVSCDEFIPVNMAAATAWEYIFWGGLRMSATSPGSFWHAGVHLPQGAIVRGLDLSIDPNNQPGGNTLVKLVRYRALPGGSTGTGGAAGSDYQVIAETPAATGAGVKIVSSPAVAHVVDEANWNYRLTFLELLPNGATLFGARIGFTPPPTGPVFLPTPKRAYDSRSSGGAFTAGTYRTVSCAVAGVPTNARGLVVNVTATNTTANGGYAVLYPGGGTKPDTSILNWSAGQTVANATIIGCGSNATLAIGAEVSAADLIIDVAGYFP